ncbi:alpha/beta hydrolase [Anderseniella sp. Alg231-50]|uniref:alpha/beta hydrolase n=1 Tax=Anderseniella sp. Alg231-50 TaxID=1922226 RepID=UPI00307C43D1
MTNLQDDPRSGPDEDEIWDFMEAGTQFYPADTTELSIGEQRRCYDNLCTHFHAGRPDGLKVTDLTCPGPAGVIALRQYVPENCNGGSAIYMHGGGFILGGLDSHDDICCGIAVEAGITVIAIHYRLAPEHTFPAAFDDCMAAVEWVFDNSGMLDIDAGRIVLAGDSAGGNLAAAVCIARRDQRQKMPVGQVLVYPALGGDRSRGSYVSRRHAPGLTTADIEYYDQMYLGTVAAGTRSPKFHAPLLETDCAGLPRAFLVACEWDPLRDDCFDYADRLRSAGVAAQVRHEPELVHACLRARHTSPAARAMFEAISAAISDMAQ